MFTPVAQSAHTTTFGVVAGRGFDVQLTERFLTGNTCCVIKIVENEENEENRRRNIPVKGDPALERAR